MMNAPTKKINSYFVYLAMQCNLGTFHLSKIFKKRIDGLTMIAYVEVCNDFDLTKKPTDNLKPMKTSDHCSYTHNLSSCVVIFSGFNFTTA